MKAMDTITRQRPPPWWLRDLRQVWPAVLVFAATILCAASAVAWTRALWRDAHVRQLQAAQSRDQARREFAQVEQEKRDIAVYQPLYRQLLARRLVGPENRLDWLDALRRTQDQYQLLPIAFDIAPRQPVVVSPAMDLGRYRLYTTRMRLQLDLLHEGDLFNLLAGLRSQGHSTVQDCTLKRPGAALHTPQAPQVTATCTLNWVTLDGGDAAQQSRTAGLLPDAAAGAMAARGERAP